VANAFNLKYELFYAKRGRAGDVYTVQQPWEEGRAREMIIIRGDFSLILA
jgi:hypothetical protein